MLHTSDPGLKAGAGDSEMIYNLVHENVKAKAFGEFFNFFYLFTIKAVT